MVEALEKLLEDPNAWSWDELAEAIVEKYGTEEATEIIMCLLMKEPKILEEVASWSDVQRAVLKDVLQDGEDV
jgi:hypothetical protein